MFFVTTGALAFVYMLLHPFTTLGVEAKDGVALGYGPAAYLTSFW